VPYKLRAGVGKEKEGRRRGDGAVRQGRDEGGGLS
jgi:hypothetical protein